MEQAEAIVRAVFLMDMASRSNGGIFSATSGLAAELSRSTSVQVDVLAGADEFVDLDLPAWGSARVSPLSSMSPRSFRFMPRLAREIELKDPDVIHLHGVWQYQSIIAKRVSLRQELPLVVSPHGALEPWALRQSALRKRVAWSLYERRTLAAARCLHALTAKEVDNLRSLGLKNPVALIPNGVMLPANVPDRASRHCHSYKMMFLGRLHPKKGLQELLRAWEIFKARGSDRSWRLEIVGWGGKRYVDLLRSQIAKAGIGDSVSLVGPLYGIDAWKAYESADAFILPSHSEGMPMAILEAWASGLPVVMTPECGLPEGFSVGAAIPTSTNPDEIASAVQKITELGPRQRAEMGAAGRNLVQIQYSWRSVAGQFEALYKWLLGEGGRPQFVGEA